MNTPEIYDREPMVLAAYRDGYRAGVEAMQDAAKDESWLWEPGDFDSCDAQPELCITIDDLALIAARLLEEKEEKR